MQGCRGHRHSNALKGMETLAIETRDVSGRGVAAFAARPLRAGEIVLEEQAVLVSAIAAQGRSNLELWEALLKVERSRRLPVFEPGGHLGALAALRDLGPTGCRTKLLTKCVGPEAELPSPRTARREVAVLHSAARAGLVVQSAATFPAAEYARLRRVIQLNGFRFNGNFCEGDLGYDVGEVLFDVVSRINHSCTPNLEFDLNWAEQYETVVIRVSAIREIEAGEEVCISYLPVRLKLAVHERLHQLRTHWLFDCDCALCNAEVSALGATKPATVTPQQPEKAATSAPQQGAMEELPGHAASNSDSDAEGGVCWDDLCDPDENTSTPNGMCS